MRLFSASLNLPVFDLDALSGGHGSVIVVSRQTPDFGKHYHGLAPAGVGEWATPAPGHHRNCLLRSMKETACPRNISCRPSHRVWAGHPTSAGHPFRRKRSRSNVSSVRNLPCRNDSASSRMRNKSTGPSARTDLASCSTNSPMRRLNAGDLAGGANDLSSPGVAASWYRSLMINGEEEPGSIVVKLDELTATLRWKMKIPCAEEADLRPRQLCNRWRLSQSCPPPWPCARPYRKTRMNGAIHMRVALGIT